MKEQLLKDGTRKVEVRLKKGEHLEIIKKLLAENANLKRQLKAQK